MSRNKGSVKANRQRTDREKLELFVSKVNELNNTRVIKSGGLYVQHRIQGKRDQPLEFELKQPDEADVKEYLMTFRHFIADSEDVFLNRIFGICHRRLISDVMKQSLAEAHQFFKQAEWSDGAHLVIDGSKFTPVQITDIYLQGKYFHNDLEYQQLLDSMPPFEADILRFHFLNFVIVASKIIMHVRNVVDHAFQEGLFQFEDATQASLSTHRTIPY